MFEKLGLFKCNNINSTSDKQFSQKFSYAIFFKWEDRKDLFITIFGKSLGYGENCCNCHFTYDFDFSKSLPEFKSTA